MQWQYVSCVANAEISGDDLMLHALPKNPSGKLLKRELRKAYLAMFGE